MYSAEVDARVGKNVASTLAKALSEITLLSFRRCTSLKEMNVLSKRNAEQLRNWNPHYPTALHSCVHEMISEQAQATPDVKAVCLWDASLTYGELEDPSTLLAAYIQREYPYLSGPEMAIGMF